MDVAMAIRLPGAISTGFPLARQRLEFGYCGKGLCGMREVQWPTGLAKSEAGQASAHGRWGLASLTAPGVRQLLMLLLALVYSNGFLFLIAVSPYLLYGFYLVLLGTICLGLYLEQAPLGILRGALPYLFWIALYGLLGTILSPYTALVLPETARMLLRSVLILAAVAVALRDRRDLAAFARLVQVAAIINGAVAVWEVRDPAITATIMTTLDPHFSLSLRGFRPGGLFINPDEAAFAFLFALVLSTRITGPLAWAGRVAAVVGIYLGASRAGAYLLALYGAILVGRALWRRWTLGTVTVVVNGLALTVLLGIGAYHYAIGYLPATTDLAIGDSFQLSRILDFSEDSYSIPGYERDNVTRAAAETALAAPVQGYGIFAMQGFELTTLSRVSTTSLGELGIGAHNMYLVVLGELGPFGLASYLLLLGFGLRAAATARLTPPDRLLVALLWLTYLLIGFVWHNLFTDVVGMIFTAFVYLVPTRLSQGPDEAGD